MKNHYKISFHKDNIKPGFRYHTLEKAYYYDLTGKVFCKADGQVIIEAEGEEKEILKFIEWHKERMYEENKDDLKYQKSAVKDYNDFRIIDEEEEMQRLKKNSRFFG